MCCERLAGGVPNPLVVEYIYSYRLHHTNTIPPPPPLLHFTQFAPHATHMCCGVATDWIYCLWGALRELIVAKTVAETAAKVESLLGRLPPAVGFCQILRYCCCHMLPKWSVHNGALQQPTKLINAKNNRNYKNKQKTEKPQSWNNPKPNPNPPANASEVVFVSSPRQSDYYSIKCAGEQRDGQHLMTNAWAAWSAIQKQKQKQEQQQSKE